MSSEVNSQDTSERLRLDLAGAWRWARRGRRRSLRLLVALGLCAAALVTASGAFWVVNSRAADLEEGRKDAAAVASRDLETLLSYDYRTIADAVEERRALVTGDFADDYADLVTNRVTPAANARKVVTRSEVVTTAVISAEEEEVELLLFINQVSAGEKSKTPVLSGSRVRVVMKKVDGRWRVADVVPV